MDKKIKISELNQKVQFLRKKIGESIEGFNKRRNNNKYKATKM
jgi:hypothetical protein